MMIKKDYHFYAAHRNKQAGAKCGRLHGHTYRVACHFKFNQLTDGIGMLFSDIDTLVEPIIKSYDHYLILYGEDPLCPLLEQAGEPFIKVPFETSAENLAIWLTTRIQHETKLPLFQLELAETTTSTVIHQPLNSPL